MNISYDTLKENAKRSLAINYWLSVAASAVVTILSGLGSGVSSGISRALNNVDESDISLGIVILMLIISLITTTISLAVTFCLTNILTVGQAQYYLKLRKGYPDFMAIFSGFQNGNYSKVFKIMLRKTIYLTLWYLLFIIPGIIYGLAYFMVDYIAAENPDIDSKRAIEISEKTMDGEKANLFLLQLSFIGWILLAILTCGIGMYFLAPYMQATYTEFYECMKAKAINNGIATAAEFGIVPEAPSAEDAPAY